MSCLVNIPSYLIFKTLCEGRYIFVLFYNCTLPAIVQFYICDFFGNRNTLIICRFVDLRLGSLHEVLWKSDSHQKSLSLWNWFVRDLRLYISILYDNQLDTFLTHFFSNWPICIVWIILYQLYFDAIFL